MLNILQKTFLSGKRRPALAEVLMVELLAVARRPDQTPGLGPRLSDSATRPRSRAVCLVFGVSCALDPFDASTSDAGDPGRPQMWVPRLRHLYCSISAEDPPGDAIHTTASVM